MVLLKPSLMAFRPRPLGGVPFVSRFLRLAYLSPDVLERLLIHRRPCALPLDRLAATALVPWAEQVDAIFDG